MNDSLIVVGITLTYLIGVLWVGLRARGQESSSLEGYVAGGRHVGVVILFFILGAEIFSAFAFLGAPGWSYQHGAPAFYILAYLSLVPITIWAMGPRVAALGRQKGYLTQGDMIADHYQSKPLGILAGVIGVLALVPCLTIQIAGAGLQFQAATDGLIPFWLGALLAFVVVAAYVFCSGLSGIGWTNLIQGIMMIAIAWFLGLSISERLYGGVGEMFSQIQLTMPEYLTMPGATGMNWGYFSTAVLVSAFGGAMWPHLFMKFYSADSGKTLRKVSVFYPLYAYLLLLGAYGLIVQLFPMVLGALFLPQLRRASVMAGALVGSLAYLLMDFVWSSPLGWHAGVWAMLLNVAVVAAWQALGKAPHNGPALAGKRS